MYWWTAMWPGRAQVRRVTSIVSTALGLLSDSALTTHLPTSPTRSLILFWQSFPCRAGSVRKDNLPQNSLIGRPSSLSPSPNEHRLLHNDLCLTEARDSTLRWLELWINQFSDYSTISSMTNGSKELLSKCLGILRGRKVIHIANTRPFFFVQAGENRPRGCLSRRTWKDTEDCGTTVPRLCLCRPPTPCPKWWSDRIGGCFNCLRIRESMAAAVAVEW